MGEGGRGLAMYAGLMFSCMAQVHEGHSYFTSSVLLYVSFLTALEQIYEESHKPEALGLSKVLTDCQHYFAIYLLDFVVP